jgi:hypothetical protein
MGHLKMGADENLAFNSWKAYSYGSSQMNSWSIYASQVKGLVILLKPLTNL